MPELWQEVRFADADTARQRLAPLLARDRPGLQENLAAALREVAAPDHVAVGLARYLEASLSPATEAALMAQSPQYARLLVTLLYQSHFLTDIICRYPQYVPWLWHEAERTRAVTREEMLAELLGPSRGFDSFEECCRRMRVFRRREILRIATRDVFDHAPLVSVMEDLSNLADATLEAAILGARLPLEARYGRPRAGENDRVQSTFVVMAMGKLGGRELNFSSDIDLLFFYSDEGKTSGGTEPPTEDKNYFRKLSEYVIKAIAEPTEEGQIFRVDMRLRPHGRVGPLAVSLDAAVAYYAEFGRAWERQALIKARPCAGDLALGERFLERMSRFVYPEYFDDAILEDIRDTKEQSEAIIAARGESTREVKQGHGGIRDIEFTVQILQLLNGGRYPGLRTRNTLEAIDVLGRSGFMSPFQATTLAANYTFLRQVEHRLQIEGGQQRHVLPANEDALEDFARRLGYDSAATFMEVYERRAKETRAVLERFLAAKGAGTLWVNDLLNTHSDGAAALPHLVALGFQEPVRAREELLLLGTGSKERPLSLHVRLQFAEITPHLLRALSHTRRPDENLRRLSQILSRLKAPATLYELLRTNPLLSHYLVILVSNSAYLSNLLMAEPGLLDTLGNAEELYENATEAKLERDLENLRQAYDSDAASYRLRNAEMLRVAMGELVRYKTLAHVGDELTLLAEVILKHALDEARARVAERFGPCDVPLAVLGLGKFGGLEMGYGSDLDLMFVYEAGRGLDSGMAASEYFAAVVAQTIQILKEPTRYGLLYNVDTRLRPDGRKGPIAVSHRRMHEYYLHSADPWERLALMKVRAVAGDFDFRKEVERLAKEGAFSLPLSRETLEHIEDLRGRLESQASPLNLKDSAGGLSEVEFTVRLHQLRFAQSFPAVQRGDVFGVLDVFDTHRLIPKAMSDTLRDAYLTLRRILNRVRMMHGSDETDMPEDPDAREELAGRLAIEEDLLELVDRHRRAVHALYLETRAGLLLSRG